MSVARFPQGPAFLLSLALVVVTTPRHADARTAPNPSGRSVRAIDALPAAVTHPDAVTPAPIAVDIAPSPMPTGAVHLDSTWYDLQDMGSLGTRIVCGADGRVHVTWVDDLCELAGVCPPNLAAPQPFPQRANAYAYRDLAGTWQRKGKVQDPALRGCCVSELLGGFGSIAVTSTGRAAVAQHMNEDGCDLRGDFYLSNDAVGTAWKGYLSPIVSPSFLFPQVTVNSNQSFALLGETPRGGSYDEVDAFAVSYLAAAGATFVCPLGWQNGTWNQVASPSLFRDGRPAFPSIASASDGRAGIAVGDFGGNVYLFESSDGSFRPGTITTRPITSYTDATITAPDSTSTQYRPYVHCHVAYNDTTPNVVWSELQARRVGGNVVYADHRSRIRHWNPVRGIETVYQVAPGVADRYDDLDQGLAGPIAGFNTLSVDWPQVGFSADGSETYVVFLGYRDDDIDASADAGLPGIVTGIGYGDVYVSMTRNAQPWSARQNVTQTPGGDERFVSLAARNPDGRVHLVLQTSVLQQAGVTLIGDRGTSPGNVLRRVLYLERPVAGTTVAVAPHETTDLAPRLAVLTNPARGSVRFRADVPANQELSITIFDVRGRRLARLASGMGAATLTWDGRDEAGIAVPSGLYFAHLKGDTSPVRFIRLQ